MKQPPIKRNRMLLMAALAVLFGASSVQAQSGKDDAGMSKEQSSQTSPSEKSDASSAAPATSGASTTPGTSAAGTSDSGKSLSKADQNIVRELAQANLAEIEAGKLALSQSKNDDVKTFAQKMIDDHTQSQKDLEQLAQAKGVSLPTEPDRKHKAAAKKLSALEGDKFDKQYMSQGGLKDHRDTHRMLERAQNRANDPELKALVEKATPIVGQHLTMAKEVSDSKKTTSGSMGPAGTSSSSGDAGKAGASGTSGSSSTTSPGKQ